jgi:hypothetical protein
MPDGMQLNDGAIQFLGIASLGQGSDAEMDQTQTAVKRLDTLPLADKYRYFD